MIAFALLLFLLAAGCLSASAQTQQLHLLVYNNTALAGVPLSDTVINGFDFSIPSSNGPFSAELVGTLSMLSNSSSNSDTGSNNGKDEYSFSCNFGNATVAFLWIDDHMVCQRGAYTTHSTSVDNPVRKLSKVNLPVRLEIYYSNYDQDDSKHRTAVNVSVTVTSTSPFKLSPDLAAVEVQRRELQRNLTRGWGVWNHDSLLDQVHLPSGVYVRTAICTTGNHNNSTDLDCTQVARPDGAARPDIFAHDRSYGQYYIASNKNDLPSWNVSVQFSGGDEMITTLELVSGNATDLFVVVSGGVLWHRAAVATADSDAMTLTLAPYGLPQLTVYMVDDNNSIGGKTNARTAQFRKLQSRTKSQNSFVLPLTKRNPVGLSSSRRCNMKTLFTSLQKKKAAELQRYDDFDFLAETRAAVQAAVMWNLVYIPSEAGPFTPVSRGWGGHLCSKDIPKEWCYTHYDWDDLFASYMMSLDSNIGKDLSYSNLIQIVRSKTSNGFVPNYASATSKSVDHSEPPVGAKVLLEMFKKHHDRWLVELLFDDLLDWSNWYMTNRLVAPLNLIVLGGSSMQNARFESGLDNSPMYDGEDYYDSNTSQMMLYDVGASSLVAMEAQALATLAEVIGRPESSMLWQRARDIGSSIRTNLWDEEIGIFCNKFVHNETFYRRISPTSFYPMLSQSAAPSQVETMVSQWLLNPSRFCLSLKGDFYGNLDSCYWGLPSISADDPAYMVGGWIYWRGLVWGPMAQLVYWGLEQMDYVPLARVARKSLVKQMRSMMLHQYQETGHICENYGPHKDQVDCRGDKYYHWGALTGFLSLLETGYY